MKLPWILENKWVQWVGWVAALEWVNTLGSHFHSLYDAHIWNVVWSISWSVNGLLDMVWVNSLIASGELAWNVAATGTWLWAAMLSNKILKDLGLESEEWKTFWAKNVLRYWANIAAGLTTLWATSAAMPYIIWGSITYWAGKHGWHYWKEALKRWVWAWYWVVAWIPVSGLVWWYKSVIAWLKWEQTYLKPNYWTATV